MVTSFATVLPELPESVAWSSCLTTCKLLCEDNLLLAIHVHDNLISAISRHLFPDGLWITLLVKQSIVGIKCHRRSETLGCA